MPQQVIPFSTDFIGATDPDLFPNPFDTVTETSGNLVTYVATGGRASTPGMRVDMAGTSADSYGTVNQGWTVDPAGKVLRAAVDVNFGIIPFAGISGSAITLIRLTSPGSGVLMNVQLFKPATGTARFRVNTVETVVNQAGSTNIAASTWYNVAGEIDNTDPGNAKVRIYVDNVLEGETTGVATFTRVVGRVLIGGITGSGVPVAGVNWNIDNAACIVSRGAIGPPQSAPMYSRLGNTQFGIPGVMF